MALLLLGTLEANNPVANADATITVGNARFTVLNSRVVRMEWDKKKQFNNQASFVAVNRNLPVPSFTKSEENGWIVIKTDELELKYKLNSGKFTDNNLSINFKNRDQQQIWKLSDKQKENLKGTYRTVDRYHGSTFINNDGTVGEQMPLEDGILSKDGWTLIDDSKNFLFDNSDWQWVEERKSKDGQDFYFMAYGNDYKQALKDYTSFAGKVPMPPRYAFGYWWSRYWNYSDNELRDLVKNFELYNLPLDVLVIDMDWHKIDSIHSPIKDEFGEMKHWTGWEWDTNLFTDPSKFLKWTESKNLKTTLNLHPASGIAPYESIYSEFAKKMNFNTASGKNIPWQGANKKMVNTLFDLVLHPMEKQGVDFWWLDWQQWIFDKDIKTLNNTWWLNYIFFSDMERNRDTRPMLYHRWGGLGNHRYQVGFSGDAFITWESLAFQPYFTSTASNVLYSYWSHDIGGHMFLNSNDVIDPEMYARWMQYGVFSPIFRTHSSKDPRLNKEIWTFNGEYFEALRNSIYLRYQLVPYIYTMARKTYDDGVGLCRPMYYDYPDSKEAYDYKSQFMFGDNMIIAPIVSERKDGLSEVKVWLPEGESWFEWHTGTMLKGSQEITRKFPLDEYPIYIKAGAVVPMYNEDVKNLQKVNKDVVFGIFPGGDGEFDLYEDAGDDKGYDNNFALTKIKSSMTNRTQHIVIDPAEGSYEKMPESRNYYIRLYGVEMPESVSVNGETLDYNAIESNTEWSYIGNEFTVLIPIADFSTSQKVRVTVQYNSENKVDVNTGLVRKMKEFSEVYLKCKFRNGSFPGWVVPEVVGQCEETNRKLEYEPTKFYENINYFISNYDKAIELIK